MQSRFKPFLWFCLAVVLLLSLWLRSAEASLSLVDPRINRLESQVRSLQAQVTRLQSQLPRAGSRQPITNSQPPAPDAPSFDQQFDHLAILIIELQERVSTLEAKLDAPPESPAAP